MSYARYLAVFLLLVLPAGLARADGLLYQLPKDGSWAVYDFDVSGIADGSIHFNVKGTVRMASVGQVVVDNKPCRWIEIQFHSEVAYEWDHKWHKEKDIAIVKLLIGEEYLAKGESPLRHVLRAWQLERPPADKPRKMDVSKEFQEDSPLSIVLSEPWKDVEQLGKIEVKSKLGNRACAGVRGIVELHTKPEGTTKCKLENRLHADSPFGVVASHGTGESPKWTMEWNLKLADFGENAQSKMPDAK